MRSKWCKHTPAGHLASVADWDVFDQYKVRPWKKSQRLRASPGQGAISITAKINENDISNTSTRPRGLLSLKTQTNQDVTNRVNQLGEKYLPNHLRSVTRVYCNSITSTIRSSWTSLTSTFRSSVVSSIYTRSSMHEEAREHGPVQVANPLIKRVSEKLTTVLTEGEQDIWDILVDEEKCSDDDVVQDMEGVDHAVSKRALLRRMADHRHFKNPPNSTSSRLELSNWSCGEQAQVLKAPEDCRICFGALTHEPVAIGDIMPQHTGMGIERRDLYDNTSLFYVVQNNSSTVSGLKTLLSGHADMMAQNSSGASFMHYYNWWQHNRYSGYQWEDLIEILEFFAARNFPFSHRNEHGQTVAHLMFDHLYHNVHDVPTTKQIDRLLTALNTDIDALDNQGHCIGQYLDLLYQKSESEKVRRRYTALSVKMSRASSFKSSNLMLDFKELCLSTQRKGQFWPTIVKTLDYSRLIDARGDSPLIAMLKVWDSNIHKRVWDSSADLNERFTCVETLVKLGVGIDVKDRRGNTALVIAARRGFRATVEQLLGYGANPNTVNYHGRSILYMSKGWLKMAKRIDEDHQYARIASCIPVLQSWQAVFEPTLHEQRLSATVRRRIMRKAPARTV